MQRRDIFSREIVESKPPGYFYKQGMNVGSILIS